MQNKIKLAKSTAFIHWSKYETIVNFFQVFDAGKKILVHKHEGHIQSRIVYYLMNVHITPRTIYLARHGNIFVQNKLLGKTW